MKYENRTKLIINIEKEKLKKFRIELINKEESADTVVNSYIDKYLKLEETKCEETENPTSR